MSVIDTLIYDRTQNDVDRVFELKRKILSQGLSSLTAEEKAEYLAGMKGAYNATDLNRVGEAVAYLAGRMTALPGQLLEYESEKGVADDTLFHVPYNPATISVTAKHDWTMADVPTQSQVQAMLADLTVLRRQLTLPSDAPAVPTSLDSLTYTTANEIEYLLFLINQAFITVEAKLYSLIDRTAMAFHYANTYHAGM